MELIRNISIIIISIVLVACKETKFAEKKDLGYSFYPLKLKNVQTYEVDSTVYSSFSSQPVLFKFNLKDSITNFYLNENNDTVFRVERYKRNKNELIWKYQKTITRLKTTRIAEEFVDNKKFVRLVFPPDIGTSWNANSKNDLNENILSIEEKFDTFSVNQKIFGETISVYYEEKNLIREDIYKAWYAKSEGLIMNEITAIDKDFNSGRITNGFVYKSKILK